MPPYPAPVFQSAREGAGDVSTGLVVVCVATHKRLQGLERLLTASQQLTFEHCREITVEIAVVDNDPARSAEKLCAGLAATSRWPLSYVTEPRRGISFARNTAMQHARSRNARFIAFIDDDEVPDPAWLDELLSGLVQFGAGVAAGPVLPLFEGPVEPWMIEGGFFDRPRHHTGERLETTRTGNVLFRTQIFESGVDAFDERLGLSGGEDSDFFFRVAEAGYSIIWVDSAIVHEWNPVTRTRSAWILRRAFNFGATWAAANQQYRPYARMALRGLAKGLLLLPVSLFQGRHRIVTSLELIAVGVGYIVGRSGLRFERYRKTDGR